MNRYPYPLLELLSTPQRVLLFSVSAGLMTLSTFLIQWVYGKVNGLDGLEVRARKPAKKPVKKPAKKAN